MDRLTHLDDKGHARMVDVSTRDVTTRTATATGAVRTTGDVLAAIADGAVPKGDVGGVARLAGILAAKHTPDIVPLCHPIALHGVDVEVWPDAAGSEPLVRIRTTARTADRTGVEMEALTATAAAGLAVIDIIKALDAGAEIVNVRLERKEGGRSGVWERPSA